MENVALEKCFGKKQAQKKKGKDVNSLEAIVIEAEWEKTTNFKLVHHRSSFALHKREWWCGAYGTD